MDFRRDIPGWLHTNESKQIKRICELITPGSDILEVGVFAGRTTQILASCCKSSNIYCIDPWPVFTYPVNWGGMTDYTGPEYNSKNIKEVFDTEILSAYDNVVAVEGSFPSSVPTDATNIGLIHWDTDNVDDRDMMLSQFDMAWQLLKEGGILSGHTFADWMPSVVNAVRHFGMKVDRNIILPPSGSIWYMIKP